MVLGALTKTCKWLKINYMTETPTRNSLVRLAYGELPTLERLETEHELALNRSLREAFEELKAAQRELPRVTFAPANATLQAVLRYSRRAG